MLFGLVAAVSTASFVLGINEIVRELGRRYAVERAEAARSRLSTLIERESALAEKLADSPTIRRWMRDEEDSTLEERAFAELESYRRAFVDSNYFVAIAASRHYYNQPSEGDLVVTTLDRNTPSDGWYFSTVAAGEEVALNLDYNPTLDASMVWINALVRDDQETIGVAGTGLEITDMISRIVSAGGGGASTMLVDTQGVIIAHRDAEIMEQNARAREAERKVTVFDQAASAGDRDRLRVLMNEALSGLAAVDRVELDGRNSLTAMVPIFPIDAMMVASVDPAAFVGVQEFTPLILLLLVSILGALTVVALVMERTVLIPLATLTNSAHRIAEGNYSLTIPLQRSDEIGTLAAEFNQMANKIREYTGNLEGLVERRTAELESANRQVWESIRYARLIQEGVMPAERTVGGSLSGYSLFHRQRDVVGGDLLFYRRADDAGTGAFLIAVVDCEGHGVSGALMTMMADSLLRQISAKHSDAGPAAILEDLEISLRETLHRDVADGGVQSGFDIGLCLCLPADQELIFSGAALPLYVRENDGSMTTIPGRRKAIRTTHRREPGSFEEQRVATDGRVFYLITDGFVDQRGEKASRAYGTGRLLSLLSSVEPGSLAPRAPDFESEFDSYRGVESQRDDVLALGFTL